jgi:hypothetical protein
VLLGAEGREAGQKLEHEDADGPPIYALAVALAGDDLGRQVGRRAAQGVGPAVRRQLRGEAQVRDLVWITVFNLDYP